MDDAQEAERLSPAPPVPDATTSGGRARRLVRLATLDVTPLRRHRDFRLLFIGRGVSFLGSMVTYVALPYQAFRITHSSLAVGLLALVELDPLLTMALVGGALADARDRRRMVQLSELGLALVSIGLMVNALLPHPRLAVLFAAALVASSLDALQRPSLEGLLPRIVERDELTAAAALMSLRSTVGMIAGPALGGVLIATAGLSTTYLLDVITFAVSLVALRRMRAVPPPPDAERPSVRSVLEGWRYARGRQNLLGTYLVDMVAMFFAMPMALFPAIAERFGGASVLGLLYAAPAVGSMVATATSGWANHVHRHGVAITVSATLWGAAIVGFGLSASLPLALGFLAAAGAADMVSGIFRSVVWNQTIPDHLRGRIMAELRKVIWPNRKQMVSYTSGPLLGNLEAGSVAAAFSVRASVVSGGLLCVVGVAACALGLPAFVRYDTRQGQTSK